MSPSVRTEDKGSVNEPRACSNCEFDNKTTRRFRVPYHLVEPGVLVVDLILVIAISLLAGTGYNWFFLGIIPAMETYAAIGVLTFTNVCAILAARGDYRVTNLLNFPRQARDLVFTWTFVLLVLIAVIFALKVAATFSRGATFTFFVLGLGGMIAWRALVAQFLKHALSAGGFASRRVIIIGEKGRLATRAKCWSCNDAVTNRSERSRLVRMTSRQLKCRGAYARKSIVRSKWRRPISCRDISVDRLGAWLGH